MTAFRPCILIPTYDNPATIAAVVEQARAHLAEVVVVDDGSGQPARERIDAIAAAGLAHVHRRAENGGKGAAVKDGLRAARELGYTHALQVDADGQHDLEDIPRFLEAARAQPESLVLGQPVFDDSVPAARLYGRRISVFWAAVETIGSRVGDPLCGYRVYPIEQALAAGARGDRMDFDPEIAVRLVWRGVPVQKLTTRVRYIAASAGGVSHFQGFRDNVRISWAHTRLVFGALGRALVGRLRPRRSSGAEPRAVGGLAVANDSSARDPVRRLGWLDVRESGSVLGMRILLFVATAFGRAPVRALLRVIALYYALFHRDARRTSRSYLRRLGMPDGFSAVYRHVLCFAQCATDRLFFVSGRHRAFEIETHGAEHLIALARAGKGALLFGAHLGSFEALNAQAGRERIVVNVVGYFRNARMINQVLEGAGGGGVHARLLEPGTGMEFALRLRDCIERGEFVAVLCDRVLDGKTVEVEFLGGRARFPSGPHALAAALGCPVLLTFGLFRAPRRYELYCEPFAERVVLPRAQRNEALRDHVQRFALRLEHYTRLAPDNWFNFYDFWSADA